MSSSYFHQSSWALSAKGQSIDLYGQSPDSTGDLVFIGGMHGDEPEGVRLATELLNWLQKNHKTEDLHPWTLITDINPDGAALNQRTNANGVDLNRNFPTSDWQASSSPSRYYSGPMAGSEPETQAICKLIQLKKPKLILHFHSWEPCIVYTGEPGKAWAQMLSPSSVYPVKEDIGYPTPGSLGNYGWHNCKIPVICIEEQEKSDLSLVWPHFGNVLIKLLRSGASSD